MRKAALFLLLLVLTPVPRGLAAAPPKLVVMIVVDQMRADYVDQFKSRWSSGLRRLVDRGAWFRRAAYP
jgi:predicted AlkP superfamily pyrophosphatase or phosphodiesterase